MQAGGHQDKSIFFVRVRGGEHWEDCSGELYSSCDRSGIPFPTGPCTPTMAYSKRETTWWAYSKGGEKVG
jgi:hypothetical protein